MFVSEASTDSVVWIRYFNLNCPTTALTYFLFIFRPCTLLYQIRGVGGVGINEGGV